MEGYRSLFSFENYIIMVLYNAVSYTYIDSIFFISRAVHLDSFGR